MMFQISKCKRENKQKLSNPSNLRVLNLLRFHTTFSLHMYLHKLAWYRKWHSRRLSRHFHAAILTFYIISIIFSSLSVFSFMAPQRTLASTSYEWDLNNASNYAYNSSEITISGGLAYPAGNYNALLANINGIDCTDANTCYIDGYDSSGTGKIYKTADGGAHWTQQYSGTALYSIYFLNNSTAYAGGNNIILKTTDGGNTWNPTSAVSGFIYSMYCRDANICFASGENNSYKGAIFQTTNGGASWTAQNFNTISFMVEIDFPGNGNIGYVVGDAGTILKTTDGGNTWNTQVSGTSNALYGIACTDANTCYTDGDAGTILQTINGGANWNTQTSGASYWLNDIKFINNNTGFAVGQFGTILKTTNGGVTWVAQSVPITHNLFMISCPSANVCYTGGYQNNLKTVNAGSDWVNIYYYPTSTIIPNVSQNYSTLMGFKENLGTGSTGTIYYQVSNDDGATWYWYDGTAWTVAADNTYLNTASVINQNISSFTGNYGSGTGKFKWKAIFHGSSASDSQKLASIQVSIKGNPPNPPQSLEVSDVSNRAKGVWAAALTWDAPQAGGTQVSFYQIERSDNGGPWHQVGVTSDGTQQAYAEIVGSSNVNYSYRVEAVEHDTIGGLYNNVSDPSNVVSITPTGKYTSMPSLVTPPSVTTSATTANITWSTDRVSSSAVDYGTDTSYGSIAGSQDAVTYHSVSLKGLIPGASYHYKIQSLDQERTYSDQDYYAGDYVFTTPLSAEISNLKISDIHADSALVSWQTTQDMASIVNYGKTTEYGATLAAGGGTSHSIRLTGLDNSSTYHLKITGNDSAGNLVQSDDYSFETLAFPKISNPTFEQVTDQPSSGLRVSWDTNVPASSQIQYQDAAGVVQTVSDYQLITQHEMILSGLKDKTSYRVVVRGRDGLGNEAVPVSQDVTTVADTRPPAISQITTENSSEGYGVSTESQLIVSWTTDEPATSQVEYEEGGNGRNLNLATQEDTSLVTSHAVIISHLKSSTPYYFRIVTKDASQNEAKSEVRSALTGQARPSVLDLILKSVFSSIGWLFGGGVK